MGVSYAVARGLRSRFLFGGETHHISLCLATPLRPSTDTVWPKIMAHKPHEQNWISRDG